MRLWKSDGTSAGTTEVADLGADSVYPILPVGGTAFFIRHVGNNAIPELWKTTGGSPGVVQVMLPSDLELPVLQPPTPVNGKLVFLDSANSRVVALNPATSTFTAIADFTPADSVAEITLTPGVTAGGKHYFTRFYDPHRRNRARGREIWVTDGTAPGTRRVWTQSPNQFGTLGPVESFAALASTAYFNEFDGIQYHVWSTDGDEAQTLKIADIGSSPAAHFMSVGGSFFFTDEQALWKSDGTPEGTATVSGLPGSVANFVTLGNLIVAASTVLSDGPGGFWTFDSQSARRRFRLVTIPLTPDATLTDGRLRIYGGFARNDTITLTADPLAGTLALNWNGTPVTYPLASVTSVSIDGREGYDKLTLAGPVPRATLLGNDGNDTLTGGDNDDVLLGGPDSDLLRGGAGNDDLFGEADFDILDGGDGADVLSGGFGGDTADYSGRRRALTVVLDDRSRDGSANERDNVMSDVETVLGGRGDDYLAATTAGFLPVYFSGGAGNDTLIGGRFDDQLFAGAGNDRLEGNGGNDRLVALDGGDTLYGGDGADVLDAGDAGPFDRLFGGAGNDRAYVDEADRRTDIETFFF